jgi:hypothetical protein
MTPPIPAPLATLDRSLRLWLAIGLLLILLLPAARGVHPAIGWLPFWLLGWPLLSLSLLHRHRWLGWIAQQRRSPRSTRRGRRQARRADPSTPLTRLLLTALRGH